VFRRIGTCTKRFCGIRRYRVVARRFDWPGVTLVAYDHTTEHKSNERLPGPAVGPGGAVPLEMGCSVKNR